MRICVCIIVLSFCIACNNSPKSKIVVEKEKVLGTEWGFVDSTGNMYLTLPMYGISKREKDTILTLTTQDDREVKVGSLIRLKSLTPISSLKEYLLNTRDKRQLKYEHYDFFTDSVKVYSWRGDKIKKKYILKEFCQFENFQIIDYNYFKVNGEIYYYRSKVIGADTATFRTFLRMQNKSEWPATLARDKNHIYGGSLVLDRKRAHEKYFFYADSIQHLLK